MLFFIISLPSRPTCGWIGNASLSFTGEKIQQWDSEFSQPNPHFTSLRFAITLLRFRCTQHWCCICNRIGWNLFRQRKRITLNWRMLQLHFEHLKFVSRFLSSGIDTRMHLCACRTCPAVTSGRLFFLIQPMIILISSVVHVRCHHVVTFLLFFKSEQYLARHATGFWCYSSAR